uniref:Putative pterin-4-alpha-carbinolamine dehydratase n=1 Tax=Magnetococcus massalia (strain MO-1) TaxID=451514 RepID=A0A1S7LGI9_MAGMO|nr:Putative pterin-4-alpha-carbinolamine dehydratase [Candidatus Magnetococcus massalia]
MSEMLNKRCLPCEGGIPKLPPERAAQLAKQHVPSWMLNHEATRIERVYSFADFNAAMAFANVVGFVAETEGHHPEIEITWGRCTVRYWTHAISGLSENDYICAAKIDALFEQTQQPVQACSIA